jgi:hypothetical protein
LARADRWITECNYDIDILRDQFAGQRWSTFTPPRAGF